MYTQKTKAEASLPCYVTGTIWFRHKLLGFIRSVFYASTVNTTDFRKISLYLLRI